MQKLTGNHKTNWPQLKNTNNAQNPITKRKPKGPSTPVRTTCMCVFMTV